LLAMSRKRRSELFLSKQESEAKIFTTATEQCMEDEFKEHRKKSKLQGFSKLKAKYSGNIF
jgi:hypothetical protein